MQFVHTMIYELQGAIAPDEGNLVVLDDTNLAVWACLTKDPNPLCKDLDQEAAVSIMLLRSPAEGGPDGSFGERLKQETALVQAAREPKKKKGTYLVLNRRGEIADWESRVEREVDDFVISLNGAPLTEIREESRTVLSSLLLALLFQLKFPLTFKIYASGVVYHRTDGKRVFAKALTGGKISAYASSPFPENAYEEISSDFRTLYRLDNLSTVLKLFTDSMEAFDDRLRSFLSGWAGLEIFVNKIFKQYEEAFFQDLESGDLVEAHPQYIARIREVMKDKYRLADKFALIASRLAPKNADVDVELFKAAKETRDKLTHGQDVDDEELPISTVHELLKRYLQHHTGIKSDTSLIN